MLLAHTEWTKTGWVFPKKSWLSEIDFFQTIIPICDLELFETSWKEVWFVWIKLSYLAQRLPAPHYKSLSKFPQTDWELSILWMENNAHCVLLDLDYTRKKLALLESPIILMNPMHHAVTMVKNHGFLDIGVEMSQKLFSTAPFFGWANFGPMKAMGTSQVTRD